MNKMIKDKAGRISLLQKRAATLFNDIFSDCVWFLRTAGGSCKAKGEYHRKSREWQLSFLLLVPFKDKTNAQHAKNDLDVGWKFLIGKRVAVTVFRAGYFCADGQSKSWHQRLLKIRLARLRLPLSFASFFRDNNDTDKQESDSQNSHSNSKRKREFFKEICGQADGYNCFTNVRNHFADKFSAFFPDDDHRNNNIMGNRRCQAGILKHTPGVSEGIEARI